MPTNNSWNPLQPDGEEWTGYDAVNDLPEHIQTSAHIAIVLCKTFWSEAVTHQINNAEAAHAASLFAAFVIQHGVKSMDDRDGPKGTTVLDLAIAEFCEMVSDATHGSVIMGRPIVEQVPDKRPIKGDPNLN